ncbi:uncharacterized protein LOC133038484 [Cannabis sativa]|uniref:uncharacterized protein LOC133038484 n=1 Tax=Cannabis sativa TaxID=3483 RepID=UPI0029CA7C4A|nr:uncharacterized protein LOC133038484 [Cannabis sativa]
MVMLITKRVDVSSLCPICESHDETILHALVTCSVAATCWAKAGVNTTIATGMDFLDWCATTFDSASNETQCLVAVLCWAIWKAQNDKVWNNKLPNVYSTIAFAITYLGQWKTTQTPFESSQLAAGYGAERWSSPVSNGVKVNVDVVVFEGSQGYGFGVVARNEFDYLIEGVARSYLGVVRPELAEAIGVREASWIKANGWY